MTSFTFFRKIAVVIPLYAQQRSDLLQACAPVLREQCFPSPPERENIVLVPKFLIPIFHSIFQPVKPGWKVMAINSQMEHFKTHSILPQLGRNHGSKSHTSKVCLKDSGGQNSQLFRIPTNTIFYIAIWNIRTIKSNLTPNKITGRTVPQKWNILVLCDTRTTDKHNIQIWLHYLS